MAAYTETVEAKNPALVATGLALWGWLLRLVVAISFIFLPLVINTVNPIIDNQPYATPQIQAFLKEHPASVAFATSHAALLTVIKEHQAVVNAVAKNPSAANIAATIKAIGAANFAQLVANEKQLDTLVVPYTAQLDYLSAHSAQLTALQNAVNETTQAVAALVLGVRGRHGRVLADDLLDQGPMEPGQGQARRRTLRAVDPGRASPPRAIWRSHGDGVNRRSVPLPRWQPSAFWSGVASSVLRQYPRRSTSSTTAMRPH